MNRLKELKAEARRIGEQIDEIETAARRETNNKKVGRYFKTRNSYSCPEKPSDYWWLYAKCTRMNDDGFLYAFNFQTDRYGKMEVEPDRHSYHMQDYSPCSKAEFKRAWRKFQTNIAKINL